MDKEKDFIKSYFNGFNKLTNVNLNDFINYYRETKYSGYPEEPSGSIWESEGKSIYVLIRILKPNRILEIGNYLGRSSNHILQAVEDNGTGEVTLLDIEEHIEYDKLHNKKFDRILQNSLDFLSQPINFDLIIQDGNHTYNHVKKEIELILKNNIAKPYFIWAHDYYKHKTPQCEVGRVWNEFKAKFELFIPFKDSVSNCGFCIVKNNEYNILY